MFKFPAFCYGRRVFADRIQTIERPAAFLWRLLVGHYQAARILLFLSGGSATICAAPHETNYFVDSWTVKDGLPHNSVRWLAQTPDGFLWAGTMQGLARFDGVRF